MNKEQQRRMAQSKKDLERALYNPRANNKSAKMFDVNELSNFTEEGLKSFLEDLSKSLSAKPKNKEFTMWVGCKTHGLVAWTPGFDMIMCDDPECRPCSGYDKAMKEAIKNG